MLIIDRALQITNLQQDSTWDKLLIDDSISNFIEQGSWIIVIVQIKLMYNQDIFRNQFFVLLFFFLRVILLFGFGFSSHFSIFFALQLSMRLAPHKTVRRQISHELPWKFFSTFWFYPIWSLGGYTDPNSWDIHKNQCNMVNKAHCFCTSCHLNLWNMITYLLNMHWNFTFITWLDSLKQMISLP